MTVTRQILASVHDVKLIGKYIRAMDINADVLLNIS